MNLQISKGLRIHKEGKNALLYHSVYGNFCKVTSDVLSLIKDKKNLKEGGNKLSKQQAAAIKKMRGLGFLVRDGEDETVKLQKQTSEFVNKAIKGGLISDLRLNISELCNCACTYCFERKINDDFSTSGLMPWDIATLAISNFYKILNKNKTKRATIRFFGGEPFLNIPVFFKSLTLAEKLSKKYRIKTQYLVNTNGTIANEDLSKTLKKFKVNTVVSLDGLPEVNDRCRVLKSGKGTFELVNRNIDILKSAGNEIYISTVIMDEVSSEKINDFIDFLSSRNLKFIGVNHEQCFSDNRRTINTTEKIVNAMVEAKKYSIRKNVDLHGFWEIPLNRLIKGGLSYCGGIGKEFSVGWQGDIFPCAGIKIKLGDVTNMLTITHSKSYLRIIKRTVGNIKECSGCEIEGMCCGGCAAEALNINNDLYSKAPDCEMRKLTMKKLIDNIHLFKNFQ